MRRTPLLALLVGVVLLSAGLLVTVQGRADEEQQRRSLRRDAEQVAAAFTAHFERARSLDLMLAQGQSALLAGRTGLDPDLANRSLRYLQVLYPGSIGEACLIDESGQEVARVTQGHAAGVHDLSPDEDANAFFAPTLRLRPNEVYQAPPYVSPDTHAWVISNSTWIRRPNGRRLLVHFEVSLSSFLPYVERQDPGRHVAIVDRENGKILLQDGVPLPAPHGGDFPRTGWSQAFQGITKDAGRLPWRGQDLEYRRIDRAAGNANDWYVVEWSTTSPSLLPLWLGVTSAGMGVLCIVGALAALRRQQAALRAAARLDHLTGLANRKALEEALDAALAGGQSRDGDRVAVLVLDLDGFKQINDALGHDRGDVVLQEIARRLHANVLEHDTAARLGGDEFAIVLRRLKAADDVATVAHRLREALIRPIEIDGVSRFVGASIGAAVSGEHGNSSEELIRSADAAMYHAKRGREGVRVYAAGTMAGADSLGLAAELMTAIDRGELDLAFQPEYSLLTGQVIGVEALARWARRGHGPVSPDVFVPLAEDTGLIRSLTSLTLRRALDEAAAWRGEGREVPVSVNLSAHVVGDASLPEEVRGLLEERGLDGQALVLEITETAAIGDATSTVAVLERLRALGVRIELDDFGSGYTSFRTLHHLPLDGVKIDRNLVVDRTGGGPHLLAATVEMAQRSGLKVIAEGIEDADTLERVRGLGCDRAQGYHLGRPMAGTEIRALLGRAQQAVVDQ